MPEEHKKTAILYARVSTNEQLKGYSLDQQIHALREYAEAKDYEIVAEVEDPGYSGTTLERPGMDKIQDLVEAGGISFVLAQDADRITREPYDWEYLERQFGKYGTKVVALDDWGDDSHEGELLKYLKGWKAKGERLDVQRRMRRGRRRKAQKGRLIANNAPKYGYRYTDDRNGYEIHPEQITIVRRAFDMVAGGASIYEVVETLNREGIKAPGRYSESGKWNRAFVRDRLILCDVYKPHSRDELRALGVSTTYSRPSITTAPTGLAT